jgi:hypothetical protein
MIGPNLREPVPGDHGARGDFDSRSLRTSPQIWAIRHRPATTAIAVGLLAAAVAGAGAIVGARR